MTNPSLRWWRAAKLVLAVAIVAAVGWRLALDLGQLELGALALHPTWLLLSAVLYVLAQGCSAVFWWLLLRRFGQRPEVPAAIKAYYVSQLGKYLPGKAWALLLRGGLVRSPHVRLSAAIIASFYEVLTTMAAGALLAAVLFTLQPPAALLSDWHPVWLGLGLLALVLVPLLPGVFNFVVGRLTARFQQLEELQLPRLGYGTLLQGLALTAVGWALLGVSVWALLCGVLPEPPTWTPASWARLTALNALAYVAGFLALVVPGGIGVREFFLLALLPLELGSQPVQSPEALAALVAVVLRLVWTATELVVAGLVWWLPPPGDKVTK